MKSKIKYAFFTSILLLVTFAADAQARLTIENNSQRLMTVKVMQGYGGKGTLHETVTIGSYGSETVYFSESGYYFTKTKAALKGKEPVYRKGEPFEVTNNSSGYSVMTLTFSIKESAIPQATGGKSIPKTEFDQN
jgi:hypothetical protein